MFNFNPLTFIPEEFLQQMLSTATAVDRYDIENELFRRKGDAQ
jgi:hypothetical protein